MNPTSGMILIQQRYASSHRERQAELDRVREINSGIAAFETVHLVDGAAKRWTFADLFLEAAERFAGRVSVLANSDIAFEESIGLAGPLAERGMLVALSRWDDVAAPSMEGRVAGEQWHFFSHSQDVWVFTAGGLPAFDADLQLGLPQCESRLAYAAAAAGVVVVNPALSIRTTHHHASAVRSWRKQEGYRGALLFPRLTTIEGLDPEALVVDRSRKMRKVEAVLRLTGSPAEFQDQIVKNSRMTGFRTLKIGLRSPFYLRKR